MGKMNNLLATTKRNKDQWAMCIIPDIYCRHGPLTRYEILRGAHAPGIPGTFPPPPRVIDPGMHHGTCETHVPWRMPGSITRGFLCGGKIFPAFPRMHNSRFYVTGPLTPMPGILFAPDITATYCDMYSGIWRNFAGRLKLVCISTFEMKP